MYFVDSKFQIPTFSFFAVIIISHFSISFLAITTIILAVWTTLFFRSLYNDTFTEKHAVNILNVNMIINNANKRLKEVFVGR